MNTTPAVYAPTHISIAALLSVGTVIETHGDLYEITAIERGLFTRINVSPLNPTRNPLQSTLVSEKKEYLVYKKISQ